MKKLFILPLFLLSACGSDEVVVTKREDVSYADIQPAAGLTYSEFRNGHAFGAGEMHAAQKRFILLDRDNNGRLSEDELGY